MNKWLKWALGESGMRTFGSVLQKVVGNMAATAAHIFWASGVVGIIQTLVGVWSIKRRGERLFSNWREVGGALTFGVNAVIATVLGCVVFFLGADLGVRTLIITLGIIPGALIDRIFFRHKLVLRQWLGLTVGLLAGYVVLGAPSFEGVLALPFWVWLAVLNSLVVAINQGVTQAIKEIDPLRQNFWGGATALVCLPIAFFLAGAQGSRLLNRDVLGLTGVAIMGGLAAVLLWTFNILSYRAGAHIALKKLVVMGTYLIATMLLGVIFFHEVFTIWKASGIILYFVAFLLMDEVTWRFFFRRQATSSAVR